jgi:hypothetical protein
MDQGKNQPFHDMLKDLEFSVYWKEDHLCGLVVRVLGYRSEGPVSIPGTTRKKK